MTNPVATDPLSGIDVTSPAFDHIAKSSLTDSRGVDFLTFRRNLRPNFLKVWFHIGLVLQDIRQYRGIHFDHHRYLGTTRDTERSYFDPFSLRFLLESLTGIRVLKVILLRQEPPDPSPSVPAMRRRRAWSTSMRCSAQPFMGA